MLRYTTDRARPGLVALYDIRPGNGAGQFLQPRSTHGAYTVSSGTLNSSIPYLQRVFYLSDTLLVTKQKQR